MGADNGLPNSLILLLTNSRDLTTDFVVLELQKRRLPYWRLNTERLPQARVTLGGASEDDWAIDLDGRRVRGSDVTAGYFRRPGLPMIDDAVTVAAERAYAASEWNAVQKSLYARIGRRWLSTPMAIVAAEDKPLQLVIARQLGFDVPETLVTNDPDALGTFLRGPNAVAKPLRHAQLEADAEAVIFTSRVSRAEARDARSIAVAPLILQREIPKRVDVRVTVVGEQVFAVAIHSQCVEASVVDWRAGEGPDLVHEPMILPDAVAARCVELVKRLNLGFGAIDLVHGRDDRFWFLEINPNGQWAWLQTRAGQPIAEAIVDSLERKSAS